MLTEIRLMKLMIILTGSVLMWNSLTYAAEPQEIPIWPGKVPLQVSFPDPESMDDRGHVSNVHVPTLTIHLPSTEKATGQAVIICPGGGYGFLSIEKEGHTIARWLNEQGIAGFVLKYRHKQHKHPVPLLDAQRAIRLVRSRAEEWHLNPDQIGVCGFSAGGHLAASVSTLYDEKIIEPVDAIDQLSARPNFAILVYPVISMEPGMVHGGSGHNLLGENPSPELIKKLSCEFQVTEKTPPCFLVHALDDKSVRFENSLLFFEVLRRVDVSAEIHLYESGGHGFGMNRQKAAGYWTEPAARWLETRRKN